MHDSLASAVVGAEHVPRWLPGGTHKFGKLVRPEELERTLSGAGLKEAQVKRAVELSAEKYCSASIMLGRAGVEITHDYEIVELGA